MSLSIQNPNFFERSVAEVTADLPGSLLTVSRVVEGRRDPVAQYRVDVAQGFSGLIRKDMLKGWDALPGTPPDVGLLCTINHRGSPSLNVVVRDPAKPDTPALVWLKGFTEMPDSTKANGADLVRSAAVALGAPLSKGQKPVDFAQKNLSGMNLLWDGAVIRLSDGPSADHRSGLLIPRFGANDPANLVGTAYLADSRLESAPDALSIQEQLARLLSSVGVAADSPAALDVALQPEKFAKLCEKRPAFAEKVRALFAS